MINFQPSILAYRTIILKAQKFAFRFSEEDILTCPNQYISSRQVSISSQS